MFDLGIVSARYIVVPWGNTWEIHFDCGCRAVTDGELHDFHVVHVATVRCSGCSFSLAVFNEMKRQQGAVILQGTIILKDMLKMR